MRLQTLAWIDDNLHLKRDLKTSLEEGLTRRCLTPLNFYIVKITTTKRKLETEEAKERKAEGDTVGRREEKRRKKVG
jgi:hypothetical protein